MNRFILLALLFGFFISGTHLLHAGGTEPPLVVGITTGMGQEAQAAEESGQKTKEVGRHDTAVTKGAHATHTFPPKPDPTGLAIFLLAILIGILATIAGLVFLVMAIFLGPPWWVVAFCCLAPLAFGLLVLLISAIGWAIEDIQWKRQQKKEAKKAAKAAQ